MKQMTKKRNEQIGEQTLQWEIMICANLFTTKLSTIKLHILYRAFKLFKNF